MFSEKYEVPVTVNPPTQSGEFVKVVENVAIPYTGGEQHRHLGRLRQLTQSLGMGSGERLTPCTVPA